MPHLWVDALRRISHLPAQALQILAVTGAAQRLRVWMMGTGASGDGSFLIAIPSLSGSNDLMHYPVFSCLFECTILCFLTVCFLYYSVTLFSYF